MFLNSSNGWLGLDVGAKTVKAAQLRRTKQGLTLVSATIPRAIDPTQTPLSQRLSELRALRALAPNLRGSDGAAVVSMRDCVITSNAATDEAVEPPTDVPMAADTWGSVSAGYKLTTKLSEVEAVCDGLDRSGIRCQTVDGLPTALARALQLVPRYRPDELVASLDWGAQSATVVVAQGGEARYARQLRCAGFDEIIKEIAEQLGLSPQDAERAVLRHGCLSENPAGIAVASALRASLGRITSELARTLSHLEGKLKAKGPKRWVLFGVAGATPGMPRFLSSSAGLAFEVWSPEAITCDDSAAPVCLFGPAVALSALRWEESL